MSNELLLLSLTLLDIAFVFFAARRGPEWLFGSIAVNLLLIGVFGAKLISIFGFTTNIGNVFYGCVFLATHFLLEKYGRKSGMKTIWYGILFIFFFIIASQISARISGLKISEISNLAILTLFSFSLRIVLASVIAYAFSQYLNICIYEWIRKRTDGRLLWIRSNGANIVSQFVDSLLFFSIAFFNLPGILSVEMILVGWCIKTVVVLIGTPLLYLDSYLEKKYE